MKVELANDLIARKVYEAASIDDKARAMAQKFVEDRYSHFCRSKNILLSRQELAFVQPYLAQLPLNEPQEQFIERSRQQLQHNKRRKRYRDGVIIILFCIVMFSGWGMWERQRYTQTQEQLTSAQDSISYLLRTTSNEVTVANKASVIQFHTLNIRGRISNTKGTPVRQATVQVFGATVKSDNRGRYELYLVLPPKYWGEVPYLKITKEFYQEASHPLDLDKDQIEWNPVLEEYN